MLRELPEVNEVLIDGTERPISRPQHKGRRDRHYSGRRKRCTVKNVVVSVKRRVVLVTPTAQGRRHDKAEADRARARLGPGQRVLGDSGFQGYEDAAQETARTAAALAAQTKQPEAGAGTGGSGTRVGWV